MIEDEFVIVDRPAEEGDMVMHKKMGIEGYITSFCISSKYARVRTFDGRYRIWMVSNLHVADDETHRLTLLRQLGG